MKAAVGRVKITPAIGTPMGGNVRVDNLARGVHDDLYCNVIILNDNNKKVCLLGLDLVGIKYSTCNDIKDKVSSSTGIAKENIVIWATHTHSGPDTSMRAYTGSANGIVEYLEEIAIKIGKEIVNISKNSFKVKLKAGKSLVHDLSFNRRLIHKDNKVIMNFEEFEIEDIIGTTGPIDPELLTLSLFDESDKLISVLVNFSLHPAVLVGYKWLFSRDYINDLNLRLKEIYGDDIIVIFANGAEGNINHINYKDPNQLRSFKEAKRIGEKLADYTKECIDKSEDIKGNILFTSKISNLPLRDITEEEKKWADMVIIRDKDKIEDMFDGIPDKTYAKMIKAMLKRTNTEFETVLQGLSIGDFSFVTLPGEVYVEFGMKLKEYSKSKYQMIIGMANSQCGYIPKEEAFSQGGYEVKTAWSSQLVYNAGDLLVEKIKEDILNEI